MNLLSKRRILQAWGLSALAAACEPLSVFNRVAPKERASRLLKANVAYGDDPRQLYDVYAPNDLTGPAPVLVFFYGGGWSEGERRVYAWAGRALAALGYVTIVPDYRLVPQVHYPDFLEDCAAAVRHVIAHASDYGGDPARLALMGHSAGAYNAMMIALDPHYLQPAKGPSPIKAVVGVAGPYDFYPFDLDFTINAFGQWPKPAETQPIHHARETNTKFLLIYSKGDQTVGPKNAVSLERALNEAGADVGTIAYEKVSHTDIIAALSLPFRSKAPTLRDTASFLKDAL